MLPVQVTGGENLYLNFMDQHKGHALSISNAWPLCSWVSVELWLCGVHTVNTPIKNNDQPLSQREELRQRRLLFQESKVFFAAKRYGCFRQPCIRFELGVNPDTFAQVEGLAAGCLN